MDLTNNILDIPDKQRGIIQQQWHIFKLLWYEK